MESKIIATDLLTKSAHQRGIHLSLLVADTGLWVNAEYYQRLCADTGSGALFPCVRRARTSQGETRGQLIDDIRLDDNTYANLAIKRALGLARGAAVGFETCHIWPLTCYDERYHTQIANLVLLPRALAGLSDHDVEIQRALQYRAFELYGWWPEEQTKPTKPEFYPSEWREPLPAPKTHQTIRSARSRSANGKSTETHRSLEHRIKHWSVQPSLNVHKIIAIVVAEDGSIARDDLVARVSEVTGSKNAYGAIASLTTNKGNAYGCVFEAHDKHIRFANDIASLVKDLNWTVDG